MVGRKYRPLPRARKGQRLYGFINPEQYDVRSQGDGIVAAVALRAIGPDDTLECWGNCATLAEDCVSDPKRAHGYGAVDCIWHPNLKVVQEEYREAITEQFTEAVEEAKREAALKPSDFDSHI